MRGKGKNSGGRPVVVQARFTFSDGSRLVLHDRASLGEFDEAALEAVDEVRKMAVYERGR